jgi:hypothetical protein
MKFELLKGYTGNLYYYNDTWYDYPWSIDTNTTTLSYDNINSLYPVKPIDALNSKIKVLSKEDIAEYILPLLHGKIMWDTGFLVTHSAVMSNNVWQVNGYYLSDILNAIQNSTRETFSISIMAYCKQHLKPMINN